MFEYGVFVAIEDSDLETVNGGGGSTGSNFNYKELGREMAKGAVAGGLGVAAATGGAGWPAGAAGGALVGGMTNCIDQHGRAATPRQPWTPTLIPCHGPNHRPSPGTLGLIPQMAPYPKPAIQSCTR